MKKLLTWIVVMAMCVMPFGALAEGETLGTLATLSLGNFSFAMSGQTEKNIGATVNFTVGSAQDGREIFGLSANAADADIGAVTLMGDAQALTAYLEGMTSAYGITVEELKQLAQQATQAGAAQMPENVDTETLRGMMEGYVAFLQDMSDPEKAAQMENKEIEKKVMAAMGIDPDAAPVTEEVSVLGQSMTLPRYDLSLTMADFDALYQVLCDANENFAKFWTNYMKLFGSSIGMDPEQASFAGIMQAAGVDMAMDVTVWADDANEWARVDVQMHINAEEDGQSIAMTIPYSVEAHEDGSGTQMTMTMDMADMGATMKMDMDAKKAEDGGTLSFGMNMQADGEEIVMKLDGACAKTEDGAKTLNATMSMTGDDEEVGVTLDGISAKGEDGSETLNGSLAVTYGGMQMGSVTLDYQGTVTGEGESFVRSGRVSLAGEAMGESISLGFDLGVQCEPLTEAAFARISDMPLVMFSELDEEKTQQASIEAQSALFSALGGLMQAPGVSELIAEFMASMESAANPDYADYGSEYGSEYGYQEAPEAEPAADEVQA